MTPIAAKALLALCLCPPTVMTALVATSPPARSHLVKAARHAVRRPPPPAAATPPRAATTPGTAPDGCENLPRFASLSVPLDDPGLLAPPAMGGVPVNGGGFPALGPVNTPQSALPGAAPPISPLFAPPPSLFELAPTAGAPDVDQWLLLMVGFGLVGSTIRVRRQTPAGSPDQKR